MDDLIALYALVGRIRLVASNPVTEAAEDFARRVTQRYGEKDLSFEDLRNATLGPHVDLSISSAHVAARKVERFYEMDSIDTQP